MLRVTKPVGFGNIVLEETPIPKIGPREVLVKNQVSLISRGSEILRRYMHEEAIDPNIMGYSVAGLVEEVGIEAAARFRPGDRVMATAPHAQYVVQNIDAMEGTRIWPIPDDLTFEQAAFLPLCTGALTWAQVTGVRPGNTVVILGQGLVGNLVMQAYRLYPLGRLIVVDALESRCQLAASFGADVIVNAATDDPVERVRTLTGGLGADIVVDCVGGKAGLTSFAQAQDMVRVGGTLHLIGLYHGDSLPLDAGKIQRRRLIGGYFEPESRTVMLPRSIEQLQRGTMRVEPLVSHRFPFLQVREAYDLLYSRLDTAMGVLLTWSDAEENWE